MGGSQIQLLSYWLLPRYDCHYHTFKISCHAGHRGCSTPLGACRTLSDTVRPQPQGGASRADLLDPDILLHLLPWCSPSRDQGLRKQYQNIRGTWTPIYPERRGELKYTPGAAMGQTGSTQHRLFQLTIYLHYNFKLTNGQMASM